MVRKRYELIISGEALKQIGDLPRRLGEQVLRSTDRIIERLNAGQRPQDMRRLRGNPHEFRVDSGEYRILFELNETTATVTVFKVGNRKDVYRNL